MSSACTSRGADLLTGQRSFWPLFELVVRTPLLEWRLPREEEFAGAHRGGRRTASTTPRPCRSSSRGPTRSRRGARGSRRSGCGAHRADWIAREVDIHRGGVRRRATGRRRRTSSAERFRAVRSVETGSWLGLAHQGRGWGGRCARRRSTSPSPASGAGGSSERRLRGQRRLHRHVALGRLRGERRGPWPPRDGSARTSASGWAVTSGSAAGATTFGSRASSGCLDMFVAVPSPPPRWLRPLRRFVAPFNWLAHGHARRWWWRRRAHWPCIAQARTTVSKCSTTGNGS